jgi:hypothetical protein
MRGASMKRMAVILSSVISLVALSATVGGADWSAAATSSTATIIFDDAAQQAQLIIPTPACPTTQPDCVWKFFLNEPKLSVDVGTVFGTSGTLTIAYPKNFCGVIQADAYIGGPPWVPKRGFQHTIEDCTPPTTTTTTPPPTTTTTEPPTTTTTTTTPVVPPVVTGNASPPPTPPAPAPAPAPPAAPTAALPFSSPASTPASAAPAELPFTGVNTKPLWFVGLTLVALGLCLLTSAESWRRTRRRLSTAVGGSWLWSQVTNRHPLDSMVLIPRLMWLMPPTPASWSSTALRSHMVWSNGLKGLFRRSARPVVGS